MACDWYWWLSEEGKDKKKITQEIDTRICLKRTDKN